MASRCYAGHIHLVVQTSGWIIIVKTGPIRLDSSTDYFRFLSSGPKLFFFFFPVFFFFFFYFLGDFGAVLLLFFLPPLLPQSSILSFLFSIYGPSLQVTLRGCYRYQGIDRARDRFSFDYVPLPTVLYFSFFFRHPYIPHAVCIVCMCVCACGLNETATVQRQKPK